MFWARLADITKAPAFTFTVWLYTTKCPRYIKNQEKIGQHGESERIYILLDFIINEYLLVLKETIPIYPWHLFLYTYEEHDKKLKLA